jgi:hypothetical protein
MSASRRTKWARMVGSAGGGSAYRFSAPACACCGDMVPGATMCVVHVLVEF